MRTCCIPGCDNELRPNGRLRTCSACRQNLHTWEKRRPAEILERAYKLKKWHARLHSFAVVRDDQVELVDHATLARKKLMAFPIRKSKARAKSNVVHLKFVNKRKQA